MTTATDDNSVTIQDLIHLLRELDPDETDPDRQIKRWRDADLLPHPQHLQGQWLYPEHTRAQLRAIVRWKASERRHDEVRFWLWWEGFPLPLAAARRTFTALLAPIIEQILATPGEDALAKAEHLVQANLVPSQGTLMHQIHRRLPDPEDQQSALITLVRMMFGDHVPLDWEDGAETGALSLTDLLDRALGFDQARTVRLDGNAPWIPESALQTYRLFQENGWFDLQEIVDTIAQAETAELDQSRDVLKMVLGPLAQVMQGMSAMLGKDALGLGNMRFWDETDPGLMAFMVISIVRFLRSGIAANIASLHEGLHQHHDTALMAQALFPTLRREEPLIAKRIDYYHHQVGKGELTFAEVNERMRQLRQEFPEALDAFFVHHPEFVVPDEVITEKSER